jgi:glycosyltransferase involved in cell wall biosynthesis
VNDDVTVVIACFNYGAFLMEAVSSALDQEGGPPRVIVVDDGSREPATLTALDELPPEVTLIRQPNAGPSAARNAGLRAADTPYLLVLDADDKLVLDAIGRLRPLLQADPGLGFSYGVARFFGAWDGDLRFPPYDPYKLLYRHTIGITALMRRELFESVGGFDVDFPAYEDWEFWVHALAEGWHGRRLETITFMYRRHGSSTVHFEGRPRYRDTYRRLRAKHPALYTRGSRDRLAAESDLGPL